MFHRFLFTIADVYCTLMEILEFLTHMIEQYGYIIVFLAIMIESIGVPMPGETALVVAAAFAGAGHLNISLVIICSAAGAIVGDAGGYWVGRRFGRPFLEKYGKWLHLTPERMEKLEVLFRKHGPMTVFFGRFFTLLRTYAALFAGIWRMPYPTFTLYNALGGIVWALTFGMVGYLFGQNLPLLEKIARTVGWALTIPLVLCILFALLWRWVVKHQVAIRQKASLAFERSFISRLSKRYSWQIHWVLRSWSMVQYTIGHIVVGLLVAGTGTYLFGAMVKSALYGQYVVALDLDIARLFAQWATPLATSFFTMASLAGSYGVTVVAAGATLLFLLQKRWLRVISVLVIAAGGQLLTAILKMAFSRISPLSAGEAMISWFGHDFPSNHSMMSLIIYGMIAYFAIISVRHWTVKSGVVFLSLFLILLIGFSRLYLGMNTLSSVLCGFAGGIVWLSTWLTVLELLRQGKVGDRRRARRHISSNI